MCKNTQMFFLVIKSNNKVILKRKISVKLMLSVHFFNHKIYYVACDTLASLWTLQTAFLDIS